MTILYTLGKATRSGVKLNEAPPGPGQYFRTKLPDTWNGIRFEIGRMVDTVRHDIGEPLVIDTAREMVLAVPEDRRRDPVALLGAIWAWVKGTFEYVSDPYGLEATQTPRRMINQARMPAELLGAILDPIFKYQRRHELSRVSPHEIIPVPAKALGDCEEVATLCATLAGAIGIKPRFRLGGSKGEVAPDGKQAYHHIWAYFDPHLNGEYGWDMDPTELSHVELGDFAGFDEYGYVDIFEP